MGRAVAVEATRELEEGTIAFYDRPRVEEQHPEELGDVQRLIVVLSPAEAAFERAIVIGRKKLPNAARHERFWGFVDLVLTPYDMHAALGSQVYGTKTFGLRHLPAAQLFATGYYDIGWHGSHAHLRWRIERTEDDSIAAESGLEEDADYIITVANPDPTAWGMLQTPDLQTALFDELELHVTIPTPFPPGLQNRFRDRRFAHLDTTEWLDHPGAELVFVGAGD